MKVSELIDFAAKTSALVLGSLYFLGFVTDNLYLTYFGIFSFSTFNLQYVFSGLLVLLYGFAPALVTVLPIYLWKRAKSISIARFILLFLTCLISTSLLLSLVVEYDSFTFRFKHLYMFEAWRIYYAHQLLYAFPSDYYSFLKYVWLLLLYVPLIGVSLAQPLNQWREQLTKKLPLLVLGILLLFLEYVHNEHLHMKYLFGGGYQGKYDLVVTDEGLKVAERLGCNAFTQGVFWQVFVIYQDEHYIYFLPWAVLLADETRYAESFRIEKDLVGASRYDATW